LDIGFHNFKEKHMRKKHPIGDLEGPNGCMYEKRGKKTCAHIRMNLVWSNLHIARKRELISAGKPNSAFWLNVCFINTINFFYGRIAVFGPGTIAQGSVSSLNFQNGHFSSQIILLSSISS
jgi:hypothetical protein